MSSKLQLLRKMFTMIRFALQATTKMRALQSQPPAMEPAKVTREKSFHSAAVSLTPHKKASARMDRQAKSPKDANRRFQPQPASSNHRPSELLLALLLSMLAEHEQSTEFQRRVHMCCISHNYYIILHYLNTWVNKLSYMFYKFYYKGR